jgi:hypothetical protein
MTVVNALREISYLYIQYTFIRPIEEPWHMIAFVCHFYLGAPSLRSQLANEGKDVKESR